MAIPTARNAQPIRELKVMPDDVNAMADWLMQCGVDTVAAESTRVYWIPAYEVLEQRGLNGWLVDGRRVKYGPVREGDVRGCQWLQRVKDYELLRATFRPDADFCAVCAIARQRAVLLRQQVGWVRRMQNALVQMSLQLAEVTIDVISMIGQAIIRAIVAGGRDPMALGTHRTERVHAGREKIAQALASHWRDERVFVPRQVVAMHDDIHQHLHECDAKLESPPQAQALARADLGKLSRPSARARTEFGARQRLGYWAGVDLARTNGLGFGSVTKILSKMGVDFSRSAIVDHLCSSLGALLSQQDQPRQGPGPAHQALDQSRTARRPYGGHEPAAQQLRRGCVLPTPVRPHAQAARQYGGRPQIRAASCTLCSPAVRRTLTKASSVMKNINAQRSVAAPKRRAAAIELSQSR